eukprot:scaffold421342_cov60-Attheya_sp.AAC.4
MFYPIRAHPAEWQTAIYWIPHSTGTETMAIGGEEKIPYCPHAYILISGSNQKAALHMMYAET